MSDRLPRHLRHASYRVDGRRMSCSWVQVVLDVMEKRSFDVVRGVSGKMMGEDMWARVNKAWGFVYRYYLGPYPLIWSGMIQAGSPNEDFMKWLKLHRRRLYSDIHSVLSQWQRQSGSDRSGHEQSRSGIPG